MRISYIANLVGKHNKHEALKAVKVNGGRLPTLFEISQYSQLSKERYWTSEQSPYVKDSAVMYTTANDANTWFYANPLTKGTVICIKDL